MKIRSPKHRKFVASQPCIITGYQGERGVPHHLMRVDGTKGVGTKSCDRWCIPLEFSIHEALHNNGDEIAFFTNHGMPYERVMLKARCLAQQSPDKRIREINN